MRQEFHHRDRFQQIALELVQLEERIVPAIIYPIIGSDYSHNSILVKFNSAEHAEVAARELTFRPANAMVSKELASSLLPGLREITFDGDSTTVEQMMNWAAALPGVDYVEANNVYRMATTPNDTWFGEQYGLHNTGQNSGVVDADIDAKEAWDITTGSGDFVVAVIDTGVDYTHPDLAANIWTNPGEIPGDGIDNDGNGFVDDVRGWDFAGNDNDPMDDNGHGTHCAGIIGAVGNNAEGVTGVNWRVKIMVLKCFSSGFGGDSEAINSLNYAVAMGAKVSSNSYGGFGYSASFQNALANARSQGHLFVAGAGNNTSNNDIAPFYPASYADENIVSVAATTNSDQLSSFSNFGATTVDIAAPGSVILSTSLNGGYAYNSGTSMATPFVAGAAALIWDRYPQLSYHEVTERLYQSVDSIQR